MREGGVFVAVGQNFPHILLDILLDTHGFLPLSLMYVFGLRVYIVYCG